jgi:probable F420-dependent oxidoreductase
MELDIIAHPGALKASQLHAQQVEEAGFGGVWWTDAGRSAYLACTASALATERLQIGTGIAVAFPRSPMVTAGIAWELAAATGGRFVLGLGSQVRAHVERRYSAEFSPPGPRMKEYVESVKAIFRAFRGEEKLSYEGKYYNFSLLPSTWSPGPIDVADPPVYVSAVLPYMSRLVGEVADGIHVHPFHSPEYVKDVQRKHIQEGLARSGRAIDAITFSCPVMTSVGDTEEELAKTRDLRFDPDLFCRLRTSRLRRTLGRTPRTSDTRRHRRNEGAHQRRDPRPLHRHLELERSGPEARRPLQGRRSQPARHIIYRR